MTDDFASFYRSHERLVRSLIFQMGAREELDDLVQQTFVKCWNARSQFQARSSLKTWVARIAINVTKDHFRSPAVTKLSRLSPQEFERSDPSPDAETRMIVENALIQLDFEHRSILALRFFQDLSLEEIAALLDEPLGTVKSRLHHAKAQLKQILEGKEAKAHG